MPDAARPPPPPAAGRLSAVFVSAFLKGAGETGEGDFIDTVIRIAVLDANIRPLVADPDNSRRFAAFEEGVPDELRRPVSINAVAASLGLPFETTRRRMHRLEQRGLCAIRPEGVMLTRQHMTAPKMQGFMASSYEMIGRLYRDLRAQAPALELVSEADRRQPAAEFAAPPVRIASRAALAYVLRYLESARPVAGDLLNAAIFMAIFVANVEHLLQRPPASEPGRLLSDDLRRHVPIQTLARALGMPFETTRRRVIQLIDRGICLRDEDGVYIPMAALMSPPLVAHRDANAANLQRLFTGLWRLGLRFE